MDERDYKIDQLTHRVAELEDKLEDLARRLGYYESETYRSEDRKQWG